MSDELTAAERAILEDAINEPLDTFPNASFLIPAVEAITAGRMRALAAENAELRANWSHDVSTLESLLIQAEAAFRRLRKAHEELTAADPERSNR